MRDLFGKGGPILLVPSGLLNLLSSLVCAEHLVLPSSFALETLALTWSRRKGKEKTENDSRGSISHGLVVVFIPAETGQTGSMDRSDRSVCSIPLYTISSDG